MSGITNWRMGIYLLMSGITNWRINGNDAKDGNLVA
jgi:hypothetical protein